MSPQNTSTLKDEPLSSRASATLDASQARGAVIPKLNDKGRMADIPLSPQAKITVERRGQIVLIGVNRPQSYNRFDPDAFFGLANSLACCACRWCSHRRCGSGGSRCRPAGVASLARRARTARRARSR